MKKRRNVGAKRSTGKNSKSRTSSKTRRSGADASLGRQNAKEGQAEIGLGDLLPGFLAYGVGGRGRGESAWLESERSDRPYRISLSASVLREYDEGDRLLARVTSLGKRGTSPVGRVEALIAAHDDPGRAAKGLLHAYQVRTDWPDRVESELAELPGVHKRHTADASSRKDFRKVPLVTIDGESARDFDDAVYCRALAEGGWQLLVAIADVSAFVRPGTPLDAEARRRSTSIYLPRQVVPMLPRALSNDLCSLVPRAERLVLAVSMKVSEQGEILNFEFCEGIIRSRQRLTYTQVANLLKKKRTGSLSDPVRRSLSALYDCHLALLRARARRGALDFETTEAELVFHEGLVSRVRPFSRNHAHRMIEESMIAANVCAATLLDEAGMAFLFRVHPPPAGEKLDGLLQSLNILGANLDEIDVRQLSRVISRLSERVSADFLTNLVLRSMQQAVYSPFNQGHFGLSLERYAHFTSPIRRYPDLLVHRAIKANLGLANQAETQRENLEQLGNHCSIKEREAERCERDLRAWYLADYAERHLGDNFEGTITGVTSFGLFVLLDGVLVEGLLHISSLGPDWYEFDAAAHRLLGEATGKVYALGEKIAVRIAAVDVDRRKVDLVLQDSPLSR